MNHFKYLVLIALSSLSITTAVIAQDDTYYNNIRTVRFNPVGSQLAMPVINLNSGDKLSLRYGCRYQKLLLHFSNV